MRSGKDLILPNPPKSKEPTLPHLTPLEEEIMRSIPRGGLPLTELQFKLGRNNGSILNGAKRLSQIGVADIATIPGTRTRLILQKGDKPKRMVGGIRITMLQILERMGTDWCALMDLSVPLQRNMDYIRRVTKRIQGLGWLDCKRGLRDKLYFKINKMGKCALQELKAGVKYDPKNHKDW